MPKERIEREFKRIVDATAVILKPFGFSKRARTFFRYADGNLALIEFQKGRSNRADHLEFTLNIGIVSGQLADPVRDIKKAGSIDAHLRARIGTFLPNPHDKWWKLDERDLTAAIISELTDILRDRAVPYLAQHLSDDALIVLWETGQSPGLTETLRTRYLARLKQRTKLTP